tara:strand:+ start:1880 stop:2584 length:705 start_codon:yes stop_codon:yes gene_type:complete
MTNPNRPAKKSRPDIPFTPVPLRKRHNGWTAERQTDFIDALADSGCVTEAAKRVGMSRRRAYRLRADPEAGSFRLAWDNALEFAMLQLQDAVVSRAIKGVPIPHYFQGKKVGEHRRYDERLAQFLLRTRRPMLYGKQADNVEVLTPSDSYAQALEDAVARLQPDAAEQGDPVWVSSLPFYSLTPPKFPAEPLPDAQTAVDWLRAEVERVRARLDEGKKAEKEAADDWPEGPDGW